MFDLAFLLFSPLSCYSAGYSILAIYCVLVQVWFSASKAGLDIYYNKLYKWVTKQHKTQDLRKLVISGESLAPSLPPEKNFW